MSGHSARAASATSRVGLPIAVRGVGVGRGRGRVGEPRGADRAGRHVGRLGHLEQSGHMCRLRRRAVVHGHRAVQADDVVACLDAGHHGHRGGRRVRDLGIMGIGLGQRRIGEFLETELVGLAVDAALLALEDAASSHGGHAHAVGDEQDDVLGLVGVGLQSQDALQGLLALHEVRVIGLDQGGVLRHGGGRHQCRARHATEERPAEPTGFLVHGKPL
jgi:hypothetical protein